MKLILTTSEYAGRPVIHVEYRHTVFFTDPQPATNEMITVELPGLRRWNWKSVVGWLSEHAPTVEEPSGRKGRRQVAHLPGTCWRPTVLDDFIDADVWQEGFWGLSQRFSMEEFRRFGDRWVPEASARLEAALARPRGGPRVGALKREAVFLQRVYSVLSQFPGTAQWEIAREVKRLDQARWRAARAEGVDLERWIAVAAELKTDEVCLLALRRILREAARVDAEALPALLDRIGRRERLRDLTQYDGRFWEIFQDRLPLGANTTGETVDITDAHEQTVQPGWDVWRGKRVGPVTPGRTALVVYSPYGRAQVFVRGERKLKFQVAKAGGTLQKYGCTLVMKSQTGPSLHRALLEIERLDTLANVDPEQAVASVADLKLPPAHPVYETAAAARTDARHARILADLLIELRFGIDADVARHLARSQARANRR